MLSIFLTLRNSTDEREAFNIDFYFRRKDHPEDDITYLATYTKYRIFLPLEYDWTKHRDPDEKENYYYSKVTSIQHGVRSVLRMNQQVKAHCLD